MILCVFFFCLFNVLLQIADSVLAAVAGQFDHRLYRPVVLRDDRGYVGASDRVHLPWHRLDRIPKLKIARSTDLCNVFFDNDDGTDTYSTPSKTTTASIKA